MQTNEEIRAEIKEWKRTRALMGTQLDEEKTNENTEERVDQAKNDINRL